MLTFLKGMVSSEELGGWCQKKQVFMFEQVFLPLGSLVNA